MTTSYSNPGGQGDRRTLINLSGTVTFSPTGTGAYAILSGTNANTAFFSPNGQTTKTLVFDFNEARVIDEATWYQDVSTSHGTWQWQGSNDGSSYTNIGSTFTLGGSTTQVQTTLNGNTTAYRYYRLNQTAGSTSFTPYIKGIDFKIDDNSGNSINWTNPNAYGARTGNITVTTDATLGGGTISKLVDGDQGAASGTAAFFSNGQSGRTVTFQFTAAVTIQNAKWFQDTTTGQGTWKWQGSNDGSSWTDIGSTFTLGGGSVVYGVARTFHTSLNGNSTAYIYYRLLQTAGTTSSTPWIEEVTFAISGAVTSVKIGQSAREVLRDGPAPIRVGQTTREVLRDALAPLHAAQTVREILRSGSNPTLIQAMQTAREVLRDGPGPVRATLLVREVLLGTTVIAVVNDEGGISIIW